MRNETFDYRNPRVRGLLIVGLCCIVAAGCYSFRTGSAPTHLRTIGIAPVDDNSGFGRGTISQELTNLLVKRFRDDNSLRVTDPATADSRVEVVLTVVRTNERLNVSATEFETVRGVTIEARALFYDNVKKRAIFKDRPAVGRAQYPVAQGATGEARAITEALENLSEEVLNATVADW